MTISPELEKLTQAGRLKVEPANQAEFDGLVRSGRARLRDAQAASLFAESRFDLADNASHALALAALRWHGLRSEARYLVFQVLPHTLDLGPEVWRVLDRAHTARNMGEYDGYWEVDDVLLADLLRATQKVEEAVVALGPIRSS